ncbi:hypothetical protein H1R20_g12087, partial [Candolleomyces eurysporus]
MYRSKRCLESCLRSLNASKLACRSTATTTRFSAARYYAQAAAAQRGPDVLAHEPPTNYRRQPQGTQGKQRVAPEDDLNGLAEKPAAEAEHAARLAEHLNGLFPSLKFPPELAHRILTHSSHVSAKYGSNSSFSFTGRRVLECYLNLFLTASQALKPSHDLNTIAEHTLNANLLGEQIGSRWGYNKAIQWTPAVSRSQLETTKNPEALIRRIGLYKVQGDAVAATLGGIYFQFGGSVAHKVFHTQILPHLLVKGGLPEVFHEEALALAKQMGGSDASLPHAESPSSPSTSS